MSNHQPLSNPESDPQADTQAWAPCSEGELQGVAQRLRAADKRRDQAAMLKTLGTSAAVMACMVVGVGLLMRPHDNLGGITCLECYAAFDDYHVHLTNEGTLGQSRLDPGFAEAMKEHLTNCPVCRPKFEVRYPELLEQAGILAGQAALASTSGGGTSFTTSLPLAQLAAVRF